MAQWLRVSSADVAEPGDIAEVCVSLEALGKTVAAHTKRPDLGRHLRNAGKRRALRHRPGLDQQLFRAHTRRRGLRLSRPGAIAHRDLADPGRHALLLPLSRRGDAAQLLRRFDRGRRTLRPVRQSARRRAPARLRNSASGRSTGLPSPSPPKCPTPTPLPVLAPCRDNDCGTAPDSAGNATADSSGGCQTAAVVHRMADAADPCPVPVETTPRVRRRGAACGSAPPAPGDAGASPCGGPGRSRGARSVLVWQWPRHSPEAPLLRRRQRRGCAGCSA